MRKKVLRLAPRKKPSRSPRTRNVRTRKIIRRVNIFGIISIAVGALLVWCVIIYAMPLLAAPPTVTPPPPMAHTTAQVVGVPVRIKIPQIKVNAVVQRVGLARDGSMAVSKYPRDAAWYGLGPRPGETGSAVLAGHLDWWNGATAVFANLRKLKIGDKIMVQDDKGVTSTFVVRESKTYDSSTNATDVFISSDGKAHLNLVTCAGTWNKRTKQYSKRLVVFADKVLE